MDTKTTDLTVKGNHEKGLDALDTLCGQPEGEMTASGLGDRLKWLNQIVRGLIASGAVKATDWYQWVGVILQLLVTLGPKFQEIIDLIRDAIGRGQTPDTFQVQGA